MSSKGKVVLGLVVEDEDQFNIFFVSCHFYFYLIT